MKTLITLILIFGIFNLNTNAQNIDAGEDKYICVDFFGNFEDTYLEATGNIPNTISAIKWEMNYHYNGTSIYLTASDFLNDTTILQPQIVNYFENNLPLKFYLTITDDLGNIYNDSVKVVFSRFGILLSDSEKYINLGDSITISPLIVGGVGNLSYSWSPNYNITNTEIQFPLVFPEVDTNYTVTVTDSLGCVSTFVTTWIIHVDGSSVNNSHDIENETTHSYLYNETLYINTDWTNYQVILYDINGKEVISFKNSSNYNLSKYPKGIYLVSIFDLSKRNNVFTTKIVKKN